MRTSRLERAGRLAGHSYSAYWVRIVRRLIDQVASKQLAALCDDDPLIRPLADYTRFAHDAIQKGVLS
jgi:hypothetical protein